MATVGAAIHEGLHSSQAPTYSIELVHPFKTGGSTLGGIFQRYVAATAEHSHTELKVHVRALPAASERNRVGP